LAEAAAYAGIPAEYPKFKVLRCPEKSMLSSVWKSKASARSRGLKNSVCNVFHYRHTAEKGNLRISLFFLARVRQNFMGDISSPATESPSFLQPEIENCKS
jgi:hypothetical protein